MHFNSLVVGLNEVKCAVSHMSWKEILDGFNGMNFKK